VSPGTPRPGSFTAAERRRLAAALGRGEPLACPHCNVPLTSQPVTPDPRVPYVRHRLLVLCPRCRRSASLDQPEP
jgi:hypothetical protein